MTQIVGPGGWHSMGVPAHVTTPGELAAYWLGCGLPESIATAVAQMAVNPKGQRYFQRAQRFAVFGAQSDEHAERLRKKWRRLQSIVTGPDGVLGLFLALPDVPSAQPYAMVYGRRAKYGVRDLSGSTGGTSDYLAREISPAEERQTYREHAATDGDTLKKIYRGRVLKHLLADAQATGGEVHDMAIRYRQRCGDFGSSLPLLRELLLAVKPEAKSPTSHTKAEAGAMTNYRIQLAELNRFLDKPAPAVIAFLATINCPTAPVDRDAIRKAWQRRPDNKA
ncbi:hypothetical protein [Aquitalea magnusonii]|uniref:hypothetical protein n=1 Tax=Aquitalea magnusonii TaxID=332411 RepID=UPI000B5C3AF3|nr:hypothetical protein [Aquitalea magnusonii]